MSSPPPTFQPGLEAIPLPAHRRGCSSQVAGAEPGPLSKAKDFGPTATLPRVCREASMHRNDRIEAEVGAGTLEYIACLDSGIVPNLNSIRCENAVPAQTPVQQKGEGAKPTCLSRGAHRQPAAGITATEIRSLICPDTARTRVPMAGAEKRSAPAWGAQGARRATPSRPGVRADPGRGKAESCPWGNRVPQPPPQSIEEK